MPAIETGFHEYELTCEAIDADGQRCSECGDTAPGNKLLIFTTVRGRNIRTHNGAFCSQQCHDAFNGLKRRTS